MQWKILHTPVTALPENLRHLTRGRATTAPDIDTRYRSLHRAYDLSHFLLIFYEASLSNRDPYAVSEASVSAEMSFERGLLRAVFGGKTRCLSVFEITTTQSSPG